jgi:hypothetical protein
MSEKGRFNGFLHYSKVSPKEEKRHVESYIRLKKGRSREERVPKNHLTLLKNDNFFKISPQKGQFNDFLNLQKLSSFLPLTGKMFIFFLQNRY